MPCQGGALIRHLDDAERHWRWSIGRRSLAGSAGALTRDQHRGRLDRAGPLRR